MADNYKYDVFLSHSAKDKAVVRPLAERLRQDGLKVWFDEWETKPGDSIPVKIEEGLEHSRVLVLCMSANAFGSDWAQLEAGTFRFRDPLNRERRFIPLRLDDAPIKASLAHFLSINWRPADREQEYPKLVEACRAPAAEPKLTAEQQQLVSTIMSPGHTASVRSVAWSPDGGRALSGSWDNTVRVWEVESGRCLRVLEGDTASVRSVVWSPDGRHALSGAEDNSVRVWEVESGRCLRILDGHSGGVNSVAWRPDGRRALSGAADDTVRVAFGSWVLLQPERINAYAQAVIRTLQADEHQRGCLMEERVLKGELAYESSMPQLASDEERFVLLAMHQTLVERGLCLRQPTENGNLLVFPSYYRRERPDIVKFPAIYATYRFTGFLDEIYATLIVRLHHTTPFEQDQLWRYAADFKTPAGKQLGVKLTRRPQGVGELDVYFQQEIPLEAKIIFCKYVHEHLLKHARDVERLRHYVCPQCGTLVGNGEVAMKRLTEWLQGRTSQTEVERCFRVFKRKNKTPTIVCVECRKEVPLWDDMEQCFASPEIRQRVHDLQEESAIVLSNQSKERALVGEVISTVALADQVSREFNVSDQGIDMEIEFTDDAHEATGAKLYLQLKSGDSYLHERKSDGAEIFTIKDERHARYWMTQAFPVLLVIRNSEGEVRWMRIDDYLRRESEGGKKFVRQIVFEGERFDVMSVRRWRDDML